MYPHSVDIDGVSKSCEISFEVFKSYRRPGLRRIWHGLHATPHGGGKCNWEESTRMARAIGVSPFCRSGSFLFRHQPTLRSLRQHVIELALMRCSNEGVDNANKLVRRLRSNAGLALFKFDRPTTETNEKDH